jgi:uncharacterized protein (DUF934 family)
MPQILKDTLVVSDNWILLDENADSIPAGDLLLSYQQWQNFRLTSSATTVVASAVWLDGHAEIEQIIEPLLDLPLIAINFPKFADGRGFSAARLIRERYNYYWRITCYWWFYPRSVIFTQTLWV